MEGCKNVAYIWNFLFESVKMTGQKMVLALSSYV